jgi:RNA 2',3'-cyclic 3'-phosphodiesterase
MRLFIAAIIPESALIKIITVQDSLKTGFGSSIRWTNPDAIHLTLKFLGEVPESKKPALWKSVELSCNDVSSFELECSKIGVFPNISVPKIIWLGLNLPPEPGCLQKEININLENFGIEKENRDFSPHLTLGRVNSILSGKEISFLKKKILESSSEVFTSFHIDKICLIKSELKPSGPIYTVLNTIFLKTDE